MEVTKYVVLDVETPNVHNNTICQIGMVFLNENLEEIKSISQIINPQAEFSNINKHIHHITEKDVIGKPTFKEFWDEYGDEIKNSIVVCHNHGTDLVVIDKQLKIYGIEFANLDIKYIDTLDICKCGSFDCLNLEKVCSKLNLPILKSHDAGNDSKMCAELFKYFLKNNYQYKISKFIRHSSCTIDYSINNFSDETKAIRDLQEYLKEIRKDDVISDEELKPLFEWLSTNSNLVGTHQYDSICKAIENVYLDGIVDEEENTKICKSIDEIVNPKKSNDFFLPNDTIIEFEGKNFVITGDFENGWSRDKCAELVEKKGGKIKKAVSGKTNYVVVGNIGSSSWKFGEYGGKIGDALKFKTPIINEETFIKNVCDKND